MNVFLYDAKTNNKTFEKILAKIEIRITDLGLNGKIVRLGPTQSVAETIGNEVRKGANTIVAVGGNELFNQSLNAMAKLGAPDLAGKKTPLAFLPVGEKNATIANLLGLGEAVASCDVLSARRIEKFRLGRANHHYFLTRAVIGTAGTKLEIDDSYTIEFAAAGEISVVNQRTETGSAGGSKRAGLELHVRMKKSYRLLPKSSGPGRPSVLIFNHLRIINERSVLTIDGSQPVALPAVLAPAAETVNLIVGKDRLLP